MRATVTHLTVAVCAALAGACGGRDEAASSTAQSDAAAYVSPGEAAGTSGSTAKQITISGCVTKVPPDGYELTSIDDHLVGHDRTPAGHHSDDPDSKPTEPNRGGENERLRYAQNPSANLGRYRLVGNADRLASNVDRQVEIQGDVMVDDSKNETPSTLKVQSIKPTGKACPQG